MLGVCVVHKQIPEEQNELMSVQLIAFINSGYLLDRTKWGAPKLFGHPQSAKNS